MTESFFKPVFNDHDMAANVNDIFNNYYVMI